MKCACPKCSATIEIPEPEVPEKGKFLNCPECNGRFWTHREDFSLRGYRKSGEIFCTHCGEEPGTDTLCRSCFTLFPDYWVVQKNRPARRKARKPALSLRLPSLPERNKERRTTPEIEKQGGETRPLNRKNLILAVGGLAVLAILLITVTIFYKNYQAEKRFSDNYVMTLYGIKSGTDHGFATLEKMISSSRPANSEEISDIKTIKSRIDGFRSRLNPVPARFSSTAADLSRLYALYEKIHSLAISSAGSSPGLPDEVNALKKAVNQGEQRIKRNIPQDLLSKIREVTIKYKKLQFMVE